MKKSMKLFMALALAVFMTLGTVPVNTVRAEEPVAVETENNGAADEAPKETDGTEQAEYSEQPSEGTEAVAEKEEGAEQPAEPVEGETPAEQAEEGKQEEAPAEEAEQPADPAEEDNKQEETLAIAEAEGETLPEEAEGEVPAEETIEAEEEPVLNAEAFSAEYELGDLKVTVGYPADTVPEGTEVVVAEPKAEAIEALKEKYGEDVSFAAADISFVYEGKEIEPKDYPENKVYVSLSYKGEEDLSDKTFETVHIAESLNEEGTLVYTPETVNAQMTDVTETKETPVYESKEIMETVQEPYEYTWTEEVTKYKTERQYLRTDKVEDGTEEVPVYEERDITEERTGYLTKTREVEKTRTVRVKVSVKWYDPSTWFGYKNVKETYTTTETYKEPYTYTVVVGTEKVQVGTEIVTKYKDVDIYQDVQVPNGTETVTHTETRYKDVTRGTGEYEEVPTGEYTTEEIVVGQTSVFEVSEFSTYVMTWGNNNGYRVTIHHGYMENGSFVEFPAGSSTNTNYPTTLNNDAYNNGDFAVLIYDFKDFAYSATYYRTSASSTPSSGGTAIWPALHRRRTDGWGSNNDWRYNNASRNNWNNDYWGSDGDGSVADNSHIYVIYTPKTITEGYTPSSGGDDPGTPTPSAFTPDVGKNVTDQKADGTYDITLGFVGNKEATESKTTARVIVVFDLSGSMEEDISGDMPTYWNGWQYVTNPNFDGTSRLTLAKNAVNALADTLLALEDSQGNKLVEMGLVTFATDGRIRTFGTGTNASNYTSDYGTYSGIISNLPISESDDLGTGINDIGRGTNWEKGLDLANSMATSEAGKTYIIFVSDGDPTYRVSRGSYSDAVLINEITQDRLVRVKTPIFGYGSGDDTIERCYTTSKEVAKSIVDNKKAFYAVGLSSDATNMTNLATYSGGTYKAGDNAEEFAASLADIAGAITDEIGLTDVTITDGVTSMSQIETQSLIGTAGNFTYNKSYPLTAGESGGYTYTIGSTTYSITQAQVDAGSDGTHKIFSRQVKGVTVYYVEYPWDNIPETAEADINENNTVVWDTSDANDQLEHGVYYSVTFTVWPKQEAYDLIADLDNGIVKITDADLAAGTKAQLRVLVNDTTYEYDTASSTWTNGLTDAQLQALIDANDASFSMKTNTGLSATYKYGGVDSSATYTNYTNGNMSLDDTSINIKKTWNNYMDSREASDVTLTITRTDEEGHKENYFTVAMGKPEEEATTTGGKHWIQTPEQDLYISLGVMSVTDGNITIREKGYDYTVEEPEYFSYRWDLTADIYHPMVVNGQTVVLIEVQDKTTVPADAQALEQNKTITASDGKTYYAFEGKLYVAKEGENLLEATNDRRSNLFINKVVEDENAPADDLFPFEITLTNPNDPKRGEEGYSETFHTFWFYVSTTKNDTGTMIIDDLTLSDNVHKEVDELRTDNTKITDIETHEADDNYPFPYLTYKYNGAPNLKRAVDLELHTGTDDEGNTYTYYSYYTGYYWFDNGATATINIKDGWYINFNNMGRDSTYTIVEPIEDLPDNYTFVKAETDATNVQGETVTPGTVTDKTVEGTIDKSNSDYMTTYTNKYEGVYYVYHSSNNEVYRYPMAVNGVKVENFDIYAMTAEGTLYGGYYSDYAGKSTGYASADLTFDENNKSKDEGTDAKAYTYQYIKDSNKAAWDSSKAYTTIGTAAVPEQGETYYLKEVPTAYLQPYTHYTYFKSDKKLGDLWEITAYDDLNYEDAGFIIQTDDKPATVVSSLTLKATNGTTTTTLTAPKIFKPKGVLDGYLGYVRISEYKGSDTLIKQYWITYDGITVKGTHQRTLTFGDGTVTGLKKTDAPCAD